MTSSPIHKYFHYVNKKAALVCLFGIFLHLILSDPLLHTFGWQYSGEEGSFYEKIHPGTVCIFLSLIILISAKGNPVESIVGLAREHAAFALLFAIYIVAFFYMGVRSGFAGLAFIIDGHISAVICALVLSYTPTNTGKKAVHFFIFFALINACIGIAETIGQFRIFNFEDDFVALHEEYFRASAFLGHPLDNAVFTVLALFATMGTRYRLFTKFVITSILLIALLAFGGRFALVFSVLGLFALIVTNIRNHYKAGKLTLLQAFFISGASIIAPLCLAGLAYIALTHGVGERIGDSLSWDNSADSRRLSFLFYHYMTPEELWLGVSADRILDITYRMSLSIAIIHIENPWIMMLMYLGLVLFPFWLVATYYFARTLMKNQIMAIQLMVLSYFAIASTSNSFGHKDACYAIMVSVVMCAARSGYYHDRNNTQYSRQWRVTPKE